MKILSEQNREVHCANTPTHWLWLWNILEHGLAHFLHDQEETVVFSEHPALLMLEHWRCSCLKVYHGITDAMPQRALESYTRKGRTVFTVESADESSPRETPAQLHLACATSVTKMHSESQRCKGLYTLMCCEKPLGKTTLLEEWRLAYNICAAALHWSQAFYCARHFPNPCGWLWLWQLMAGT